MDNKSNKIVSIIGAGSILMTSLPLSVFASAGSDGDLSFEETGVNSEEISDEVVLASIGNNLWQGMNLKFKLDEGKATATVVDVLDKESLTEVEIPGKVVVDGKEYSVTSIGHEAFWDCKRLKKITIPYSVTSIGDYAFYDCESLKEIEIPYSVTSIGERVFGGCTSLTSIDIQNGIQSIGDCAFEACKSLKEIEIPSSVTSIGHSAFYGCTSLISIEIQNGVQSIGNGTFWDCTSLKEITIPSSVTSIGKFAFGRCESLKEITIPANKKLVNDCNPNDEWTVEDVLENKNDSPTLLLKDR